MSDKIYLIILSSFRRGVQYCYNKGFSRLTYNTWVDDKGMEVKLIVNPEHLRGIERGSFDLLVLDKAIRFGDDALLGRARATYRHTTPSI